MSFNVILRVLSGFDSIMGLCVKRLLVICRKLAGHFLSPDDE